MPTTLQLDAAAVDARGHGDPPRRPVPRPALPSGRAVLGGLLVALAALGTVVLARDGNGEPDTSYLVAVADLVPGGPVDTAALELQALTLSPDVADAAFTSIDQLDATTLVSPIRAGELVQRGAVRPVVAHDAGSHHVSVAVPRHRALDGDLVVGDRVDVLATYGSGDTAVTDVVAVGALVIGASSDSDAVGTTGALVVTLALDSPDTVLQTAHAGASGDVTLTRSAHARPEQGVAEFRDPTTAGAP